MALVITRKLGAGLYINDTKMVLTDIEDYSYATFAIVSDGDKYAVGITDSEWVSLFEDVKVRLGKPFQRQHDFQQVKLVIDAPRHVIIEREERYNEKLASIQP